VAPGRILDSSSNNPQNLAFSQSYLSTTQAVSVCEDVAFRVAHIKAGSSLQLGRDDNATHICSLATGKLRVKFANEPEFVIGPHGMFKVKPGAACTVQNRLYIDATLHISSLEGFS